MCSAPPISCAYRVRQLVPRAAVRRAVELQLVGELGRVAAHVDEPLDAAVGQQCAGVLDSQPAPQPLGILDQVFEQERVGLGDRVVAEVPVFE